MAKRVVLYSMKNCSHCDTAKKYLENQNISFRLCDVRTPKGQKEFAKLGLRGVPVLKVGDQLLKGFSVKAFLNLYE